MHFYFIIALMNKFMEKKVILKSIKKVKKPKKNILHLKGWT